MFSLNSGRFEQEFVEDRRRQLELWLNRICHHPVLCASFPVQHFLTCELTEKNNKVNLTRTYVFNDNNLFSFVGLESRKTKS